MRGQKERFSPPAVGGVSLLVVFAVLCLTVFALLSLSTVRADTRLGDASAQAVADYYAADCAAQEILARLRRGEEVEDVSMVMEIVHYPDVVSHRYAYACSISNTQELRVKAEFSPDGTAYTILHWQVSPAAGWTFDDSLNVWDGSPLVPDGTIA